MWLVCKGSPHLRKWNLLQNVLLFNYSCVVKVVKKNIVFCLNSSFVANLKSISFKRNEKTLLCSLCLAKYDQTETKCEGRQPGYGDARKSDISVKVRLAFICRSGMTARLWLSRQPATSRNRERACGFLMKQKHDEKRPTGCRGASWNRTLWHPSSSFWGILWGSAASQVRLCGKTVPVISRQPPLDAGWKWAAVEFLCGFSRLSENKAVPPLTHQLMKTQITHTDSLSYQRAKKPQFPLNLEDSHPLCSGKRRPKKPNQLMKQLYLQSITTKQIFW